MDRLAEQLRDAGRAHHQAFSATEGEDAEWPLWYAEYLHDRINEELDRALTLSELVYLLVAAERDHRGRREPWPEAFATFIRGAVAAGTTGP